MVYHLILFLCDANTEVGQGQISERLWKLIEISFYKNKNFKSFLVKGKNVWRKIQINNKFLLYLIITLFPPPPPLHLNIFEPIENLKTWRITLLEVYIKLKSD